LPTTSAWDNQIRGCVARLRALTGTAPDAPDLAALVGELVLKSPDFAGLWERYEVKGRKYATKSFPHPQVGDITLGFQAMHLEGTPDHDAMLLLDMTATHPAPNRTTQEH
jgi:hypothetical protein